MMKMRKFRIQNYKCIEDSGWIEADDVTVLVGKNESGKTAILQALHKFNPATDFPFDPLREFPRKRYTRDFDKQDWPVVSIVFDIPRQLRDELSGIDEAFATCEQALCTRHYSGRLTVELLPEIDLGEVTGSDILNWVEDTAERVRETTLPGKGDELSEFKEKALQYLDQQRAGITEDAHSLNNFDDRLRQYRDGLSTLVTEEWHRDILSVSIEKLDAFINTRARYDKYEQACGIVSESLPIFIYFENYGILDSKVHLPTYLQQVQQQPQDSRVRTTRTMFIHTGLDPEYLDRLGRETDQDRGREVEQIRRQKDERAILTESASFDLTGKFSDWWSQRRHRIEFQLDGSYLRLGVSDDKDPSRIEFEERSKGFQWFFSFYLVFLVESEEGHKDAILLLDEPGLHLHPTAKHELIEFLNKLSVDNQLVYTTHSPFMIDGDRLDRVRACFEQEDGTVRVSEDVWPRDRESIFPLQAALGYSIAQTLFQGRRNLIVEGITDYWILKALSDMLQEGGRIGLDPSIIVTPAAGAKKATYLASLMLAQDVEITVLLDSDEVGRREKRHLLKELFLGHEDRILLVGDVLGCEEADIEDMFPREYYLKAVARAYGRTIGLNTLNKEEKDQARVVQALKMNFERKGWGDFEKWKPARWLLKEWGHCKLEDLPEELVGNAERLFQEINKRLTTGG